MRKHNLKVIRHSVHPTYVYFKCTKCSFIFSFMRDELYDLLVESSTVLAIKYKEQLRLIQMCPIANQETTDNYHDSVDWALNGS